MLIAHVCEVQATRRRRKLCSKRVNLLARRSASPVVPKCGGIHGFTIRAQCNGDLLVVESQLIEPAQQRWPTYLQFWQAIEALETMSC